MVRQKKFIYYIKEDKDKRNIFIKEYINENFEIYLKQELDLLYIEVSINKGTASYGFMCTNRQEMKSLNVNNIFEDDDFIVILSIVNM